MPQTPLVHLHVHTEYSLLDGACRIGDLVKAAKAAGAEALAITDHGNLFGMIEFYGAALDAGIKPILGYEAYVAPGRRQDRETLPGREGSAGHHLILLAENEKGFKNLIRLATTASLDGFYYRPRIDKAILAELHEGLIGLSGCLQGEVSLRLLAGDVDGARRTVDTYRQILGAGNFYLEVQDHGIDEERRVRPMIIALAREMGVPLVATNDVHYIHADDTRAHDVLLCISTGKLLSDENRMRYREREFFLRSPEEMLERFSDVPEALANTVEVARRCNLTLNFKERHAPVYPTPPEETPEAMLRRLCDSGLVERYGTVTPALRERLEKELKVIEAKKFSSYFLIVWDFVRFAREHHIPCAARGSGVGCMVAYLLRLSTVDPIKYGLLFERFMDPSRNEMPDLDIDICQDGRKELIRYVREKYGEANCAQIITFGTMAARAAIRDVGRVLNIPLADVDRIAKKIPAVLHMTLEKALEQEPDLRQMVEREPLIKQLVDIAMRLEGVSRHASVHAAGVVIADAPLVNYVPLCRVGDDVTTQWDMTVVEKIGLLKMDFLGLRTLTTMQRAVDLARRHSGVEVDLEKVPLDDPKVFALFQAGATRGVFQFESAGMRDLLQKLKPDKLDDLIAANALYRPGPMVMIDDFIARKHGKAVYEFPHPWLEEILGESYGIMAYQEQVMRIVNRLGDIPLERAYKLIKAISKKKHDVIASEQAAFVAGCRKNNVPDKVTDEIWNLITLFGGYGFNKSHASAYALLAYHEAYLKAHFPKEFMAALLTFEMADSDKLAEYMDECGSMGIAVEPPDVNESGADFTVVGDGIRFGLAAVKGIGDRAIEAIVAAREKVGRFTSLIHFCEHVDLSAVNRSVVESLIKGGAFDSTGARRSQLAAIVDRALAAGGEMQEDTRRGQTNLFGAFAAGAPAAEIALPDIPEWPESKLSEVEKTSLGLYVKHNPLGPHKLIIRNFASTTATDLATFNHDDEVSVGGRIKSVRALITKTGRAAGSKMAVFELEDINGGNISCVIFPKDFAKFEAEILADRVVFIKGSVDRQREEPQIRVSQVEGVDEGRRRLTQALVLRLREDRLDEEMLKAIRRVLRDHPGTMDVWIELDKPGHGRTQIRAGDNLRVSMDDSLERALKDLMADDHMILAASRNRDSVRL